MMNGLTHVIDLCKAELVRQQLQRISRAHSLLRSMLFLNEPDHRTN